MQGNSLEREKIKAPPSPSPSPTFFTFCKTAYGPFEFAARAQLVPLIKRAIYSDLRKEQWSRCMYEITQIVDGPCV